MTKKKLLDDHPLKSILGKDEKVSIEEKPEEKTIETENSSKVFLDIKSQEKKSKRVSLLLKPSVHLKAVKKCKKNSVSLNDVINQLLEVWTE